MKDDPDQLERAMGAIMECHKCGCEVCSHSAALCPATASSLIEELAILTIEHNAALKLLGYDEVESDLLANITRLKAHYEQELAYLRQGSQNLQDYCDRLIAASDPVVAVSTALNTLSRQQDEKTTKPERNP